ncbi:MAG: alpha/beta hydrolase [Cyanobacteria bacterium J06638_20]
MPIVETRPIQRSLYFISGLGADERVFQRLKLEGYRIVHLRWEMPERGEDLASYAQRLSAQIDTERPVLVGLSFGGLVATEIAKQQDVERVILISSAKTDAEIPGYFKFLRWFPIHHILPFKSLLWAMSWLVYWFFGLTDGAERVLLGEVLHNTDAHFLKWALHRLVTWRHDAASEAVYHVHGSGDRIFPLRYVSADCTIPAGGHFMVWNRAAEISQVIDQVLERDCIPV